MYFQTDVAMMSVTLKQIFGQIVWAAGFMTVAFLLLDIPRVRTGVEKVPYWPVYGIKMLSRMGAFRQEVKCSNLK